MEQKRSFALPEEAYAQIGGSCFALSRVMPQPQLPELNGELVYLGANGRPDALEQTLYLATKGGSDPVRVLLGQPQYLELSQEGFSLASHPTHLWITPCKASGNELTCEVGMETPEKEQTVLPHERKILTLTSQEVRKGAPWQMGQTRVDGSLLARHRARWFGEDRFLSEHGGDDYSHSEGKEKVEFGEGATAYSCFVGVGEGLVWKEERWTPCAFGGESCLYPLLVLARKEERALHFELWDEAGRVKTPITVMRSKDGWLPNHLKEALRFVAAKTWSQFVLEWGQDRIPIRPGDWLLLDKEGWKVLGTSEEILEYAAGRLPGELLVIEGLARSEGKHLLQGHLFNTTRSDRIPFEIPLTLELRPGALALPSVAFAKKSATAEMPPPKPEHLHDDPGAPITIGLPRVVRGALKEETL